MMASSLRALVAVLCLLTITAPAGIAAQQAERDRLAQVLMDVPNYAAIPSGVLTGEDTNTINRLVFEAREFGVPHAIRVMSTPTSVTTLGDLSSLQGAVPAQQQVTQRLADEWLANEQIETSEGAEDGILLLVVIPQDDHTKTTAAYATGPNALPQNGLTRERLDRIVTDVMHPYFADNRIGAGIMEGTATLNYENLFVTSPRLDVEEPRQSLQTVTNFPLAALTIASALVLTGFVLWIRRRHAVPGGEIDESLSPFAAGAIARGRVDEAITTGAILHLIELGSLIPGSARRGVLTLEIGPEPLCADPFARHVWAGLRSRMDSTSKRLSPSAMRQLQELLLPSRQWLEDDLASRGLFNRNAKVETVWMVLACAAVMAIALYTVAPSIIAMARWGVVSIVAALIAVGIALWWTSRRSWSTPAGLRSQQIWDVQHRQEASPERAIYEAIVYQDALLGLEGGRATMSLPVRLVRTIHGLGAA
jgi:uncharacterized membrane protein YgcG